MNGCSVVHVQEHPSSLQDQHHRPILTGPSSFLFFLFAAYWREQSYSQFHSTILGCPHAVIVHIDSAGHHMEGPFMSSPSLYSGILRDSRPNALNTTSCDPLYSEVPIRTAPCASNMHRLFSPSHLDFLKSHRHLVMSRHPSHGLKMAFTNSR